MPDYAGAGKAPITVAIPDGASLKEIGSLLTARGVIKSTKAWDKAVSQEEAASTVQAGRYLMHTQMPAQAALRLLINPGESRIRLRFTVKEGLRLSDQVAALVKGTKIKESDYTDALDQPQTLGLPRYAGKNPEGLLYPETYELTDESTATSVLRQMVAQYNTVAGQLQLEAKAKKLGRSPYDVLIVASIIEREVRNPAYRPKVARVLYNRLDRGQKRQLDSTVIYAVKSDKTTTSKKDRRSRSRYNTYRYEGLPPGPISAPGRDALMAAANPSAGSWLYFVTVNFDTGETRFSADEAGYQRDKAAFQAWCQANSGKCT